MVAIRNFEEPFEKGLMNVYLAATILFASLVTWSHGHALMTALVYQGDSELVRKKLWNRHLAMNGTLWLLLFADIVAAQFLFPRQEIPVLARIIGLILTIVGVVLVVWARVLLGHNQAMGKRFFFPETTRKVLRGPFQFVRNPMYDGFILVLVGLGLTLGIFEDAVLALVSFVLLNVSLSRIENRGL